MMVLPVLPNHMMKLATRRIVPGSSRVKGTRGKYSDDAMRADHSRDGALLLLV